MTHSRVFTLCVVAVVAIVSFVTVPRGSTQNVLGECALTFDDPAALGAIPDQASFTFAPSYRMSCSPHFVNVETLNYKHFHLSFEDPSITCVAEGGFGKPSDNNECTPVDWDNEPRFLQSHVQDHWIKIWMEDGTSHQPRAFDLRRIHVGSGFSIQLWYRTQDGSWWFWNELQGGENWKVEQWSKDVMEVRVRGTNTGLGAYTIYSAYVRD